MPSITTAVVALGGLGLSASQYAQANKKQKEAQKAAQQFTNELKNISRINNYKALGVPTLGYDLAKESQAQSTVASLDALKSMGAEGAGLVPRVQQQNLEQDLALAAKMEQAQNRRDMLVMQEQSAIDKEKTDRDAGILEAQASGAQQAAADAQTQKTKAIEGMVGSAVAGLGAIKPRGVVNTGGADATAGLTAVGANATTPLAPDNISANNPGNLDVSGFYNNFPNATPDELNSYLNSGMFPDGTIDPAFSIKPSLKSKSSVPNFMDINGFNTKYPGATLDDYNNYLNSGIFPDGTK